MRREGLKETILRDWTELVGDWDPGRPGTHERNDHTKKGRKKIPQ